MMASFCPKNVPEICPEVVVPERSGLPSGTVNCMILYKNKRSDRKTFRPKIRNDNILILKEKNVPVFSSSLRLDRGRNKNRPHYLVNMIIKWSIKRRQTISLDALRGTTLTTQQTKYEKRTAAMFLQEPATVLTTPNHLEKRHG
jgi:hypothetical protein